VIPIGISPNGNPPLEMGMWMKVPQEQIDTQVSPWYWFATRANRYTSKSLVLVCSLWHHDKPPRGGAG